MALKMITGEQVKTARLLVGWSQYDLACEAGISSIAVYAIEHGCRMSDWTMLSMREALEEAGVEFSEAEPPQICSRLRAILELEAPPRAGEGL
jgi:transcriptional regulator with XRE-family HTH domain